MKQIDENVRTTRSLSVVTLSALLTSSLLINPALAFAAIPSPSASAVQTSSAPTATLPLGDVYAVNAGGGAAGGYSADTDFRRGRAYTNTSQTVNTVNVPNAAPAAVYSDAREGDHFSYKFNGLSPNTTYAVIMHFAELYWTLPEQRQFNVSINGANVLSNFDICATAGSFNAVVEFFLAQSDPSGTIEIDFSRGAVDQPTVNAIEIRGDVG